MEETYDFEPGRRHPAKGVHIQLGQPTIAFVTVCTKDRGAWLACPEAHRLLRPVWLEADKWLVGDYLLMPDHLHLFAGARELEFPLDAWIQFWKSEFSKAHPHPHWIWQTHSLHHRLRRSESYAEKWLYVQLNPVRAGLVQRPEDWPYKGRIHDLGW